MKKWLDELLIKLFPPEPKEQREERLLIYLLILVIIATYLSMVTGLIVLRFYG